MEPEKQASFDLTTPSGRLNDVLREKGWGPAALHRESKVSRPVIFRHLAGQRQPDREMCRKYARAIGCRFEWLATGDGERWPAQRNVERLEIPDELQRVLDADPPEGVKGLYTKEDLEALRSIHFFDGTRLSEQEWKTVVKIRITARRDEEAVIGPKIRARIIRVDDTIVTPATKPARTKKR